MKCNVGLLDKIIRRSVGMMIIGVGFYYHSWWGLVGLFPIMVSFLNFCPIYLSLKINTKRKDDDDF